MFKTMIFFVASGLICLRATSCSCSMTNIMSAHSVSSLETLFLAPGLVPADLTSYPSLSLSRSSAVGLLSMFQPHMNKTFFVM